MSVIVEFSIPAKEFPLGRILGMEAGTRIVIETTVPLGDKTVPFIRVFDGHEQFESTVQEQPGVQEIRPVSSDGEEVLYALDWDDAEDQFFEGIRESDGTIMHSRGTEALWEFEVRFASQDALSEFQDYCQEMDLPIEMERLYNPTKPEAGPWFGLTPPQRAALTQAIASGYYDIPRQISTKDLAETFGITDQAMTERLRRAITNLVSNTLLVSENSAKS